MANLHLQSGPEFEGQFSLEPNDNYAPSPDEQNYRDVLKRVMQGFADDRQSDPQGDDPASQSLLRQRLEKRAAVLAQLRTEAGEFVADQNPALYSADRALMIRGKHVAELQHMQGMLFLVDEMTDRDNLAIDLNVAVTTGLPPPNDTPSAGQQELYAGMMGALTVIKAVYQGVIERNAAAADERDADDGGLLGAGARNRRLNREKARRKLDHYVRELAGIGRVGLQSGFLDLGKLALNTLRSDLVAMEAARIKNSYAKKLGSWSLAAVVVALVAYAVTLIAHFSPFTPFIVAAAGCAVGTWLSFSLRRVTLSFEQLAAVEEDMLEPALRILFVMGLTLVAVLVFYTGALNVQMGNLDTGLFSAVAPADAQQATQGVAAATGTFVPRIEAISLLVGLLCGIAERALATAVSTRASEFVGTIGGSPRT